MEYKIITNIDEIPEDEWNKLSNDVVNSWGWYKVAQEAKCMKIIPRHILIYDKNKLVAIAPGFIEKKENLQTVNNVIFRGSKIFNCLNLRIYPSLIMGWPASSQSAVLIKKPIKKVYQLVLEVMDEICKKENIAMSSFFYLHPHDPIIPFLKEFMEFPIKNKMAFFKNKFSEFNEYIKSLSKNSKKAAKREIRKNIQLGITIKRSKDISKIADKCVILTDNLLDKYNENMRKDKEYFLLFHKYLKDKYTVYTAHKENKLIGYQITLLGNTEHAYAIGLDYSETKNTYTYFNLAYYSPILDMIKNKTKDMVLGFSCIELKKRRGAYTMPLSIYVKPQSFKSKLITRICFPIIKLKKCHS